MNSPPQLANQNAHLAHPYANQHANLYANLDAPQLVHQHASQPVRQLALQNQPARQLAQDLLAIQLALLHASQTASCQSDANILLAANFAAKMG